MSLYLRITVKCTYATTLVTVVCLQFFCKLFFLFQNFLAWLIIVNMFFHVTCLNLYKEKGFQIIEEKKKKLTYKKSYFGKEIVNPNFLHVVAQ